MSLKFIDFLHLTEKEFKEENNQLSEHTKVRNLNHWNSLNALIYISSIKEAYGVALRSTDLAERQTLGELFELIQERKTNGV